MSATSGKISGGGFDEVILPRLGHPRHNVKRGAAFGVDVSLIDIGGGQGLALTSDPLSLIPTLGLAESAWLSVHLMANDMATTGFSPMYAQMVLNLPVSLSKEDFTRYWDYIHQYCDAIGVAITGGHTGSIEEQNSTIAGGGTMLLTAPINDILLSSNARQGDVIIVTKECALSSAAILAMSFPETVKNKLGNEIYNKACALFYETSSLPDALAAATTKQVTAMHDVTEGGVLGAVYEMAIASGLGVRVQNDLLPLGDAQQQITELFGIDARFCIGAGAMVMAVNPDGVQSVLACLAKNNIKATVIGEFADKQSGYILVKDGKEENMPYFERDPYWAAFFNALKRSWK
ncbi:AIR synthase family protein [Mucilaginibacter sp. KACC 22063]|uniref:AIR synthase family protein n=1 Tax=Mucilaginibacter sp. KACC 22063 TaxID=3025666 RepID=UPI002365FF63|nr:AIR synthase family protein [Mucilaginibacter sp. KACC 22063]WDF57371.1 AIR synthase family protein [Mucilaginibacter sp. KACC 22063]